jgi:glutaredoxin
VLRPEGISERAIFVIDKYSFIRYAMVYEIDKQPENEEIFTVLRRLEPQLGARPVVFSSQPAAPLPHGGIVLYCTSWCPECRRVRTWLKSHNLPFQEVDIDTNPAGALQVKQWANGTRTTPIIDVDGTIVIRFDEARLTQLLLT